jgi:hypothetical protein
MIMKMSHSYPCASVPDPDAIAVAPNVSSLTPNHGRDTEISATGDTPPKIQAADVNWRKPNR